MPIPAVARRADGATRVDKLKPSDVDLQRAAGRTRRRRARRTAGPEPGRTGEASRRRTPRSPTPGRRRRRDCAQGRRDVAPSRGPRADRRDRASARARCSRFAGTAWTSIRALARSRPRSAGSVTGDIYGHTSDDTARAAIDHLSGALGPCRRRYRRRSCGRGMLCSKLKTW
jgi:hypothetical protein